MGRPGHPVEHVGCYVLLASNDSSTHDRVKRFMSTARGFHEHIIAPPIVKEEKRWENARKDLYQMAPKKRDETEQRVTDQDETVIWNDFKEEKQWILCQWKT